jgi:predicted alpha/beta superfamily hydrolase
MKYLFLFLICTIIQFSVSAQNIDTLKIQSKYLGTERTVYIHTPEFYKYQSEQVKLPVIYVLDAQHEWFVKPTLSTIRYLQYTHEIPQAIIVEIPHEDRVKECNINSIDGEKLPLHNFIVEELATKLKAYNTNDSRVIIGHSFSASFALYSYLQAPDFYSAVLAHSPLNEFEGLIAALIEKKVSPNEIFISVGGLNNSKDKYHRENYEKVKSKYPDFFQSINTLEANTSAHNAVPMVANPVFLTNLYEKFSTRFTEVAEVDMNYQLVEKPISIDIETQKIKEALAQVGCGDPMEIPEINGIASRYSNSGFYDYAAVLYEKGIALYPNYFEFHWYLGELYLETNKDLDKAIQYLNTSKSLIAKYEAGFKYKEEVLFEIDKLIKIARDKK